MHGRIDSPVRPHDFYKTAGYGGKGMKMQVPNYLTPVAALTAPMEVIAPVREKTDADGTQKRSTAFGGKLGWIVPLELVRGTREKRLLSGEIMEVLDTETINATIWNSARPDAEVGDYVVLVSPMIGAVEGNSYVQALDVTASGDELSALLGDGDE